MHGHDQLTLRDIYLASRAIDGIITRTPLVESQPLADRTGGSVFLKLENLQPTGSFKIRGAANKLLSLRPEQRARGVITVSTGNHGRAVSYVSHRLGVQAMVCMSTRVPTGKVEAIRQLGAEVVVHGDSYDEAEARSRELEKELGLARIEPFDDPLIIAGQGTIGLELLEDLPEIDTAIVPLSGGGLMSGIALALKSASEKIRIIGVSMDRAPVMYHSLRAGSPIEMEEEETIADGLAGGIGLDNRYTFPMVQQYMDESVLVTEEEISSAMAFALAQHHLVIEGAGAVGIAALLNDRAAQLGRQVAVVVSGGNVDLELLLNVASEPGRHRLE